MLFEFFKLAKDQIHVFEFFNIAKNYIHAFWHRSQNPKRDSNKKNFIFFKLKIETRMLFFAEERTSKKSTDSLFWNLWKSKRYEFNLFCKLKILRHAQIQSVKTAKCFRKRHFHFYKRKRYTKVLFNKMFFPKIGKWARRAHASAKRLPPFFGKKHFIEKNFYVLFAFVKNGTGDFWNIWQF